MGEGNSEERSMVGEVDGGRGIGEEAGTGEVGRDIEGGRGKKRAIKYERGQKSEREGSGGKTLQERQTSESSLSLL
jgi:hypothetical protein